MFFTTNFFYLNMKLILIIFVNLFNINIFNCFSEDVKNKIRIGLMNAKMSTERAKQTMRAYYEMRTRFPDFFTDLIPGTDFYNHGKKYMYVAIF